MKALRWAGGLWLFAAVFSVFITVVFRTNAWQWPVTLIAGAVGVVLGLWLIGRPNFALVRWSSIAGVAWLIIYAFLTLQQSHELVAWATDVFLAALGIAAAIVAYGVARVTSPSGR